MDEFASNANVTSHLDDTTPSERAMNIPLSHARLADQVSQSDFDDTTVRAIAGSPESITNLPSQSLSEYFTPRIARIPPHSLANFPGQAFPGSSRPSFTRSATSPSATAAGRSPTSSSIGANDSAGSSSRLGQPSRRDKRKGRGHEWTVFGELIGSVDADDRNRQSASSSVQRPGARDSLKDFIVGRSTASPGRRSSLFRSIPSTPDYELHASSSTMATEPDEASTIHAPDDLSNLSDDDSETQSIRSIVPQLSKEAESGWCSCLPTLTMSPLARNILKCCIAYFIGSMFTYSPYLSGFIADIKGGDPGERVPSPSGHMVTTITVYFNPAKTVGGMLQADAFCFMGLLYATFISLGSMSMYWFFEVRAGWEWLADCLVILWIGIGMSGMAYMKMWMAKPTFNTACSMTSIILFVVVVKEGGVETLLEVSAIVLVGSLISNLVCFLFWPQRATRNLHKTMSQTLDSFSTLLTMITETFLLEEPLLLITQEKLDQAAKNHQSSFTKLKKDLDEAQSERVFGRPGQSTSSLSAAELGLVDRSNSQNNLGQAYDDAVDSLNRLGQHLNGLRSGIGVQYELVKASRDGKLHLRNRTSKRYRTGSVLTTNGQGSVPDGGDDGDAEETALLQAAADAFGDLIEDLGPPLKALSGTCSNSLKRLREVFNDHGTKKGIINKLNPEEFIDLLESLERALFTFESTSNHAVVRLYRRGIGSPTLERRSESLQSSVEDNAVLMGADSESIFLVYFFFFTMQEFTRELVSLVDAMRRICSIQRMRTETRWWKSSWQSLRTRFGSNKEPSTMRGKTRSGLRRRLSAFFSSEHARRPVVFPKVRPHAPNTKQTPAREELPLMDRIGQTLWAIGDRLRENDCKFAIKAGMATAMLAAPAFFDSTRPFFTEYKGEWALISFFVVIAPTVGATNFLGLHRVLGTILGAATAVAVWTAFPENPWALSIFGFFFSIPCFYYIVSRPDLAASARFVLLTYNLTCLYCYNLRQVDISVVEIAFNRAAAVTVGVVWAAIVSRFWWPIEARRELGKALGEFCLNIGWLYTRLVAFNSWENNSGPSNSRTERSPLTPIPTEQSSLLAPTTNDHLNESIIEFMAMELHLQIKLIELQGLLAQTQHEPRLKGPFPIKLYRSMLTSLQTILDKMHSMRCVTSREEWHTTVRRDFIVPTNVARREMVGNVILYFSVLASAFRLKSPLPPYLPPAENARRRLVEAIRQLDVVKNRDIKGSRQLLFFAYALTMRGVIQELDYLGKTLQDTFGVIGESTDAFEALFRDTVHDST